MRVNSDFAKTRVRRLSPLFLTALWVLGSISSVNAAANEAGQSPLYNIGQPASAEDIAEKDIDVMPDGRGLPAGSGSVEDGEAVYLSSCAHCHGEGGQGGPFAALAGGLTSTPKSMAENPKTLRTVGNYWPYATTLFDYIRRAMPFERPGSLSDDEVYALTAYVLRLNGLIDNNATVNAKSLPKVMMPAASSYRGDDRATGAMK
jgi:cytochrome c